VNRVTISQIGSPHKTRVTGTFPLQKAKHLDKTAIFNSIGNLTGLAGEADW
jgi:hypothetical protein